MKSVLLTGVCGGIGQVLADQLTKEGWTVFGIDRVDCPSTLHLAGFWKGSVANEEFWSSIVVPALKSENGLDAFVHNAGIQPCSPIVDTTLEEWNSTMAVNLTAAFLGTRFLAPLMEGKNAAIVNVASVHAMATSAGMSAYVTSKGGLLAFTRAAALELADLKIRVNAVLPGAIDTPMLEKGLKRNTTGIDDAEERLLLRTPLKRLGTATDVANAVSFLLDEDQSSFMTGQVLVIDGGALAQLSTE